MIRKVRAVPTEADERFLQSALAAGAITHEAAIAARRRADKLAAAGTAAAVWDILVEAGEMTADEAASFGAPRTPAADGTTRLGRYRITDRIGAGGMGAVYKAIDERTGHTVALKVLPPKLAASPELVESFLTEAGHTIKLSHPNIVQGLDAGCVDGYYYFAMEFIDGVTAGELMKERGPLPENEVVPVAASIAMALQHADEHGLVHGDVKPENIMITSDGKVKLADLGVARSVEAAPDGPALGTPYYISPEQARSGKAVDIRSDIYSLGATLFHLLAGKPPYLGPTPRVVIAKHIQHKTPDIRDRTPGVSKGLSQIIKRMMAKDPRGRYQDPSEILRDFQRLQDGKPIVGGAQRISRRSGRAHRVDEED